MVRLFIILFFFSVTANAQWNALLLASQQQANSGGPSDPILALSPTIYYNDDVSFPSAVDGAAASNPIDLSANGLDGTNMGSIIWNIGTNGDVQREFDGTSWIDIPLNAVYDFNIGVDNFTLIGKSGDLSPFSSGYIISKAEATGANREYGLYYSGGTDIGVYLGGSNQTVTLAAVPNQLFILIFTGSSYELWVDGVLELSGTLGTAQGAASQSLNIGARTDGAFPINAGRMLTSPYAIVPSAISTSERQAIETEFQVN